MLNKIHHIAYVVRDLDRAVGVYEKAFGCRLLSRQRFAPRNAEVALFQVGEVLLEIIQPLGPGEPMRHLERFGEGFFHIAFEVDGIQERLGELESRDVKLLDRRPRPGLNWDVAWIDPESTFGVQTQLVEAEKGL